MKRKLFSLVSIVAGAALIAVACGKKEDKKEEPSANAAGIEAAGALSLNEPSKMVDKTALALASAKMTNESASTLHLGDGSQSTKDPLCSNNGEPWDSATSQKMADGNDFAPRQFYCLVNSKVTESSETVPGFLAQLSSIMCTLESELKLNVDEFTEDGKEYLTNATPSSPQSVNLPSSCWPQGQPDNATSVPFISVRGKKLAESTGWQYQVSLSSNQVGDITLKYFNKDGVFGFLKFSAGNTPGKGEGSAAVIDTKAGVVLYDSFDDRNKDGVDKYRRITRLRVKGTFDKDLKFSEITEGRGLNYVSGPGFSAESGSEHVFSTYTVDGTKERGYMFKTFKNSSEAKGTVSTAHSACKDGNCEGSTDIGTNDDMKALVFRNAATTTSWGGFADRKPMCEKDGAAAISYSALFPNTGAFGKCE